MTRGILFGMIASLIIGVGTAWAWGFPTSYCRKAITPCIAYCVGSNSADAYTCLARCQSILGVCQ